LKKQAKITSKGQITLPYEIRREMGVRAGDKVEFEKDDAGFHIRPVRTESPFEKFRGIGNPGLPRGKKAILHYIREMRGG
jgi:antitoxin PrlF